MENITITQIAKKGFLKGYCLLIFRCNRCGATWGVPLKTDKNMELNLHCNNCDEKETEND